jgi:hypothetical protein
VNLTHRTCSTCGHWRYPAPATAPDEDTVNALCSIQNVLKRGGDKCSKWTKVEPIPQTDPWDFLG